jgi:uncharacterized protein
MTACWRIVGRIAGLYRHPIKSMASQSLASATLDRHGIAGDRRFALRRRGDVSGFPWLSASKLPALVRYFVETLDERDPSIRIRTPDGETLDCDSDSVSRHFRDVHGVDVDLMHLRHGMFDCAGISIITLQTLASLESLTGMTLDIRRFRPNIVIDADVSPGEYPENEWVNRSIALGDPSAGARLAITELDERCSMINIDPESGGITPGVLRVVARERANCAGVYATPMRPGDCAIGDPVCVREE